MNSFLLRSFENHRKHVADLVLDQAPSSQAISLLPRGVSVWCTWPVRKSWW